MNRLELNHWFINENEMSINLLRFYVEFMPWISNNELYFVLKVHDGEDDLFLRFEKAEDCITFTETISKKCDNLDEVLDEYRRINDKIFVKK